MEIACYLPLAWLGLIYLQRSQTSTPVLLTATSSPILVMFVCLLLWLIYLLITDLINAQLIESPRREFLLFGSIALSSLVLIRLALYPTAGLFDVSWFGNTIRAIFNFTNGWRAEMVVILLNLFLWIRVVMSLGRSLTFMSVGLSFRLSLLLAIVGNGLLYNTVGLSTPLQLFTMLLAFGLLAVALARIDEKTIVGEHSTGAILTWNRLGLLGIVVAVALGSGLFLTNVYTPHSIMAVLLWFSPLWAILGTIAAGIFSAIFWLIAPLLQWLIDTLRSLTEGMELLQPSQESNSSEFGQPPTDEIFTLTGFLQEWTLIRYGLVLVLIGAVAGFLWLFFVRPYLRQLSDEEEELEQESANLGVSGLRGGLDRLRSLAKLVSRFGISLKLLDAISIENMYANLGRIARQRGYPRQPNQPPDEYINVLQEAFPGQADGLRRLTSAYMRVHYGDQSIGRTELDELRTLYQDVRVAKPDTLIEG